MFMQIVREKYNLIVIISLAMCLFLSLFLNIYIYYHTKSSYWNQGVRDGIVDAKIGVMTAFRNATSYTHKCSDLGDDFMKIEIVSVKNERMDLVKHKGALYGFCEY